MYSRAQSSGGICSLHTIGPGWIAIAAAVEKSIVVAMKIPAMRRSFWRASMVVTRLEAGNDEQCASEGRPEYLVSQRNPFYIRLSSRLGEYTFSTL